MSDDQIIDIDFLIHMNFTNFNRFALIFICFLSTSSYAQPLMTGLPLTISADSESGFIVPNEVFCGDGIPIFSASLGGVYISVGTERGFIGAALAQASRLVLVDVGADVVRFNRINIGLLKLAQNRLDYVRLRTEASPGEWMQRAENLTENDPARPLLADQANWDWWIKEVNQKKVFQLLVKPFKDLGEGMVAFENSSYLIEDSLFDRIHSLAKQDRIESHLINLKDLDAASTLSNALKQSDEKIGILDLSNVWDGGYLGIPGVTALIDTLEENLLPQSIILQTGIGDIHGWTYNGLTFEYLKNSKNKFAVIKALYTEVCTKNTAWNALCTLDGVVLKVLNERALSLRDSSHYQPFPPAAPTSVSTRLIHFPESQH